jgi:hypothetical protein
MATSAFLAISIVVQAFLAGSGVFDSNPDLITVHEMLGNVIFLAGVAQIVVAFIGLQKGTFGRSFLIVSIAILALVVAQIGLGYASRDNVSSLAWHLPNGVLLMGACTWSAVLAWGRNRA